VSPTVKGTSPAGLIGYLDEPRLLARRHKGELCLRRGRQDVHEEVRGKAVRYVRRKVKVILPDFAVLATRRNLPRNRVDEHVRRLRERGAALNIVVANETEYTPLGEHRQVIVH
jgi:hypothetical protein